MQLFPVDRVFKTPLSFDQISSKMAEFNFRGSPEAGIMTVKSNFLNKPLQL